MSQSINHRQNILQAAPVRSEVRGPAPTTGPAEIAPQRPSATHREDGSWHDAQVELSDSAQSAQDDFLSFGKGKGMSQGKGHTRKAEEAEEGFKNHGQMVSAAAKAGIHGQDLAAIAKGDVTVDKAGIEAIANGDMSLSDYGKAQAQVSDGKLTADQLGKALAMVSEKGMSLDAAITAVTAAETAAAKPAEAPAVVTEPAATQAAE